MNDMQTTVDTEVCCGISNTQRFIGTVLGVLALTILAVSTAVHGRDFFCAGADIECLFDSITEAKFNGEPNTIFLDNGIYSGLQLPSIAGPFPLSIIGQEPALTIIQSGEVLSTIFFIASEANLTLDALTLRGAVQGSGIHNQGTLNINNVTIHSNTNFASGGGLLNRGTTNIANSTVSNNFSIDSSGGGIYNDGLMTITGSSIVNNVGGGAITSGNGILNAGTLHISTTTIARNTRPAEVRGGGIDNVGILTLANSTISENRGTVGGGIFNLGSAELVNTILAGNFAGGSVIFPPGGPDCGGSITSLGGNLIGEVTNCDINLGPTDIIGNPGLGPYTEEPSVPGSGHYPLLPDSLGIDSAIPEGCAPRDQLDNERIGQCDIGSVEFQGNQTLLVSVDMRPNGDANRINPTSTKLVNVALFSGNGFDATTVDPNSIRFGVTGNEATPIHVARRDINADGFRDVVLRFQIQDLGIQCGSTSATLTGQVTGGPAIIGSTPIATIGCKDKRVAGP